MGLSTAQRQPHRPGRWSPSSVSPTPGTPLTVGTDSSAVLYYTLLLQRIAYYYDSVASPALSRQYTQETADATASAQELLGLPPPAWQTPKRGQQWKPSAYSWRPSPPTPTGIPSRGRTTRAGP